MKNIKVPAIFQELFGKTITLLELWLTLIFSLVMTIIILVVTYSEWQSLAIWQALILIVLTIDITGGAMANFSSSTNLFYKESAKARLIFIIIHIQPVLIAWLFGAHYVMCLAVWAYTIVSAFIVNALIAHPCQRIIGAGLTVFGIGLTLLLTMDQPTIILVILIIYMFKVIYGFSVDHEKNQKQSGDTF